MRPFHLAVQDTIKELGGPERLHAELGVYPGQVYRYGQDPLRSGQDIPTVQFRRLLASTRAQSLNMKLRALARELLTHFTEPAGFEIRSDDPITELRYVQALLERQHGTRFVKPYHCPDCGSQLKIEAFVAGVPVFGKCQNKHIE